MAFPLSLLLKTFVLVAMMAGGMAWYEPCSGSSSSGSGSSWSSSSSSSSSGWGKEPNYDDIECHSYYECHDHHATLQHCPHGYQFDYHEKECLKDEEVLCKWQIHESDTSSSSSSSSTGHGSSHGAFRIECHEEHGKEPDYHAEHCETYYECHEHHGFLQHCPHGHQFDWHDKECYEDKYVYCQEQRHSSHESGHTKHHTGEYEKSEKAGYTDSCQLILK